MKKTLYFIVTLWIVLWIQVASNHFLGGTLFSAQWILIAVLHFGLSRGPWTGELLGFVWGLLMDASSMGLLGVHAILFALAGYTAGILRRQLDSTKISTQAIFSWMVTMVYFALYFIVQRFFAVDEGTFQWGFVTVPLMNALIAPVVFRTLEWWAEAWDMKVEER